MYSLPAGRFLINLFPAKEIRGLVVLNSAAGFGKECVQVVRPSYHQWPSILCIVTPAVLQGVGWSAFPRVTWHGSPSEVALGLFAQSASVSVARLPLWSSPGARIHRLLPHLPGSSCSLPWLAPFFHVFFLPAWSIHLPAFPSCSSQPFCLRTPLSAGVRDHELQRIRCL